MQWDDLIPKNIKKEQVLAAISEIEKTGFPEGRGSKKFFLRFNGKNFPPKYVISLANKYANGSKLDPSVFGGGNETNSVLERLGFDIVENNNVRTHSSKPTWKAQLVSKRPKHDERCVECKATVMTILKKIYGNVEQNYRFEFGTLPSDFEGTKYHESLKKIYEALQNHRGNRDFVKAKELPPCDFFVRDSGFILEFDESQHFTSARKIALELYPDLKLGFDREKWIELCLTIDAKDNNPPYRDEQRAWYDTIRDFLPEIAGLKPTVRLSAQDLYWCSLNPDNNTDAEYFRSLLETKSVDNITVRKDPNPYLARIILTRACKGDLPEARAILKQVCEKWPENSKVKLLITPGGFLQFAWPKDLTPDKIGDNKKPEKEAISYLVEEARKCVNSVLSDGLSDLLVKNTDYITFGVDSYKKKISTTRNFIGKSHVELVVLVDLKNQKEYWTGKSYPTSRQENSLVRIEELSTHFFDLDGVGRTMLLGCHDLTVFNPRSRNASGWRMKVNQDFNKMAQDQKPICVLHHPHTTVTRRTWLNAWCHLLCVLPSVKYYAGAGVYFESDRPKSKWSSIDEVRGVTKKGDTLDFLVS